MSTVRSATPGGVPGDPLSSRHLAATFGPFALLLAASLLGSLATQDVEFRRTHATAWSMTLLVTPAMGVFLWRVGRRPLDDWWRLYWTFAWWMSVVHFYYGLYALHDGRAATVFQRQGFTLAFTIFFLVALWGVDLAFAWLRTNWRTGDLWLRWLTFAVAFVSFFISTVIFNNDVQSLLVGLVMTLTVAGTVVWRWTTGWSA